MVVYRNKPKSLRANLTYLTFSADTLGDWERLCDDEGKATYLRSSNLFGTYLFFSLVFVAVQCRCFLLCVTLSSKNTNNTRGNWTREISYKKLRPRLQWWFLSFWLLLKQNELCMEFLELPKQPQKNEYVNIKRRQTD